MFYFFYYTGCFHQRGMCVSEENVFLKCIVHKTEPLDLLFDYSESVQNAILLLPLLRDCSRGFECSQQQSIVQSPLVHCVSLETVIKHYSSCC